MADDPKLLASQAQELTAQGQRAQAIDKLRQAVAAAPASAAAAHNLAAALGDAGRWREAETHVRAALSKNEAPESWLVLARCLQARGALDDAEATFLRALALRPTYVDAHFDLAQLRWMRSGDETSALAAVDAALAQRPGDPALMFAKVRILENVERTEDALALARGLADSYPNAPALAVVASHLAAKLGDSATALILAARATKLAPEDAGARIALAMACLGAGDPARAEAQANEVLRRLPNDQHAIALLATAWRLQGDARYRTLYDCSALVKTFWLEPPPGWPSLQSYLEDLRDALGGAHRHASHPFNQSVRHGAQIPDILTLEHAAIAALPQAIGPPIDRYIAELGQGDDPVRRRSLGGHALQGIWSIRMQAGGYHVNHVHPNGWISSACYVEVPEAAAKPEGWIKFGEPGVRTAPPLGPEHLLEPQPGMLVLFPSYMWHGVVPYTAAGARMTFAFDLEPAPPRGQPGAAG